MSTRGILDADMATVGGWLRDGFRWWREELAALVPARWRRLGKGGGRPARFDGVRLTGAVPDRRLAIALAPECCLVRTIERPLLGERDLARMLAFDADRLLPMPAGEAIVASRVLALGGATMRVALAAIPIEQARLLTTHIATARAIPQRIFLDGTEGTIEFLPAFRQAGFFAGNRHAARGWWAAVAFLFLANIALLVWRDAARTARLEEIVEQQRPAVTAARAITNRVRNGQRAARAVLARRAVSDPLWVLGQVSVALPPGAWVQRFGWSGETLKLAGYRPRDANVVAALRRTPGFLDVRNTNADTVAEVPAGQPFDVSARVRRP